MIDPAAGPFLFDTSAESWLARQTDRNAVTWLRRYLRLHPVAISAVTVTERVRGYSMLWRRAAPQGRERIEAARVAYLSQLTHGNVLPVNSAVAVVAGEVTALVPDPPTPPRRSHRLAESRQDRLARWRFDGMIAATALVAGIPLVHNNAADFEAVRSALSEHRNGFLVLGRSNSFDAHCFAIFHAEVVLRSCLQLAIRASQIHLQQSRSIPADPALQS